MKALIVDDESYILEYLAHAIDWQHYGFSDIERTTNSIKAKEMLTQTSYDLLLTDIRMPEVSGMDLLKMVCQQELPTAVYFLSGYAEFEYAREAIHYGLSDYLLKPITSEKLQQMVVSFLKQHPEKSNPGAEDEPNITDMNRLISDIQSYIVHHIGDPLTLNQIADKVYLNPTYLSTLYKNQTGGNLSTYILSIRMKKAAELLLNSRLRIADIAQMVGYKKPQYFDQLFRSEYGQTPQQYRRESIKEVL